MWKDFAHKKIETRRSLEGGFQVTKTKSLERSQRKRLKGEQLTKMTSSVTQTQSRPAHPLPPTWNCLLLCLYELITRVFKPTNFIIISGSSFKAVFQETILVFKRMTDTHVLLRFPDCLPGETISVPREESHIEQSIRKWVRQFHCQ